MSSSQHQPALPDARVLWGRVATAVVVVLLAFGLGRCTADGVPEEEAAALDGQVAELQATNEALRSEVEDLTRTLEEREAAPTPSATEPTEPTEPSTPAATPGEGEPGGIYTIAPGDTLVAIAIDVYGDREMARMIAAANGIENSTTLQVGQVLELPPAQ